MNIRNYKPEDLDAMVELTLQWGYVTSAELLQLQLKRISEQEGAAVFVAEINDTAVGQLFIMEHPTLGGTGYCEVHTLVVHKNFRKRGIGKALIARAKEWSAARGFKWMKLRTNVAREEANKFYPLIGFDLEKVQNVYRITV